MFQVRQGDVFIERLDGATPVDVGPEVERRNGTLILAYGEATGHAHAISEAHAELFTLPGRSERFLRITASAGAPLVHEEHRTIVLPPGNYLVRIQREYTPGATRPVWD